MNICLSSAVGWMSTDNYIKEQGQMVEYRPWKEPRETNNEKERECVREIDKERERESER